MNICLLIKANILRFRLKILISFAASVAGCLLADKHEWRMLILKARRLTSTSGWDPHWYKHTNQAATWKWEKHFRPLKSVFLSIATKKIINFSFWNAPMKAIPKTLYMIFFRPDIFSKPGSSSRPMCFVPLAASLTPLHPWCDRAVASPATVPTQLNGPRALLPSPPPPPPSPPPPLPSPLSLLSPPTTPWLRRNRRLVPNPKEST